MVSMNRVSAERLPVFRKFSVVCLFLVGWRRAGPIRGTSRLVIVLVLVPGR